MFWRLFSWCVRFLRHQRWILQVCVEICLDSCIACVTMVKLLVAWSSPLISSVHSCCHSSLLQLRPRQSCVSTRVKELSRTSSRAAPFQHSDVSLTSKATHYIRRSSVRICINFDKNNNEIVFRSVCLKIFALWSSVLVVYRNIGLDKFPFQAERVFFGLWVSVTVKRGCVRFQVRILRSQSTNLELVLWYLLIIVVVRVGW